MNEVKIHGVLFYNSRDNSQLTILNAWTHAISTLSYYLFLLLFSLFLAVEIV